MIQWPGSPASSRLCRSPPTKLSRITTTITTSAIPSAVISDVVRRTIRLRRLYVIGITAIHDRVESAARRSPARCWLLVIAIAPGATLQVQVQDLQTVGQGAINRRLISAVSDHQTVASATRAILSSVELLSARSLPRFGVRPTDSSSTPQYERVT